MSQATSQRGRGRGRGRARGRGRSAGDRGAPSRGVGHQATIPIPPLEYAVGNSTPGRLTQVPAKTTPLPASSTIPPSPNLHVTSEDPLPVSPPPVASVGPSPVGPPPDATTIPDPRGPSTSQFSSAPPFRSSSDKSPSTAQTSITAVVSDSASSVAQPVSDSAQLPRGPPTKQVDRHKERSVKAPLNYHGKKQPPDRPGFGTKGKKMLVRANFFPIRLPPQMTVYHYDVVIDPAKLSKAACRKVSITKCL